MGVKYNRAERKNRVIASNEDLTFSELMDAFTRALNKRFRSYKNSIADWQDLDHNEDAFEALIRDLSTANNVNKVKLEKIAVLCAILWNKE